MESRFFTAGDGINLHYLWHECTRASGHSYCILLHGFTNDAHVWDQLAGVLQASHHVLALDFRGHGDSEWDSAHRYSHWQLADDLSRFLDALFMENGRAEVHIVGHSLGARVAMLALESILHPIASLTIVDAGPEVNPDAGERLVNDVRQLPGFYETVQAYRDSLSRIYMMADTVALAHVASFGLRVKQGRFVTKTDPAFTPGIWHKNPEFRSLYKERGELSEQLWRALSALNLPVHLVRGQASSILEPTLAARMIEALGEHAVLSIVPRAGHAVMLDNPEKSTALISSFIAGVKPRAGVPEVSAHASERA